MYEQSVRDQIPPPNPPEWDTFVQQRSKLTLQSTESPTVVNALVAHEFAKHNPVFHGALGAHGEHDALEAKSGYGLTVESELLQLRALKYANQLTPQRIIATCLALHALHKEASSGMDFATEMAKLLLPQVAKEQLATFVDAFVEKDYFTAEEAKIWFLEAKKLGFGVKLHADEFTDSKGADLAATLEATSADHLQFASEEGLRHMARSKVVATLLPGTSLYTGIPFTNGRRIADLGCAVAIASDFNPGSSPFVNLPFLAAMAGVHGKLKPAEIIAGVTFVAAKSLGIESLVGSLEPGYHGDFFIHPSRSVKEWIADMGKTQPSSVFIDGIEALL
jgi:imidazolonepropionase